MSNEARDSHASCTLPGCQRPNQQSSGTGHSRRYCKHHVEFHRRHGSYWHRSFTAPDLAPFRKLAVQWLRANSNDQRVRQAVRSIEGLLENAGRAENAYGIRGMSSKERARVALARLRKAEIDPMMILERIIAVTLCFEARGMDERQREFRHVQLAKSVHRLASGTHKTTSGFPLPSKYPRSEGQVLRHLGMKLDDIAAFAIGGRDIRGAYPCE